MRAAGTPFESQARIWLLAFCASAVVNVLGVVVLGLWVLANVEVKSPVEKTPAQEVVAWIVPLQEARAATDQSVVEPPAEKAPTFARTSPDQEKSAAESPDFIGERNTRATSDSVAEAQNPDQPNQRGREPKWEDEVETTESNYQDGDLSNDRVALAEAPPTEPTPQSADTAERSPADPAMRQQGEVDAESELPEAAPPKEKLAEGPVAVDRMVKDMVPEEAPKATPPRRRVEGELEPSEKQKPEEQPKQQVAKEAPGFRGFQQKTRLVGSLSRVGRSALNVEDSVLGRYHAAVSRAVEREWQRNCVRNRDFIVPGQLTLSFVLDASGKVRSKYIVEVFGVGDIQKGFTLNSIRDAEIPAMPADLKKQLDGEPLELIYRFNF
ncbi:hypothetical protein [Luteolibacter marinus]|uniref:hypothetical protein n=1 Tax=Luteolibacter marinus TaxID=2776705 RepID=UPI0018666227|nr:hypothetical protein [Luteolibacter marinus]